MRGNLFVWKLDQHLERLFVNMKIMRMTSPYGFDEYRQAVLDWARAKRFREDVHMRMVTYFGISGAGEPDSGPCADDVNDVASPGCEVTGGRVHPIGDRQDPPPDTLVL